MFQLALACSRVRPDPVEIRRLATQSSDWPLFLSIASRHGVAPLAFWNLNRACRGAIPPETLAALGNIFQRNTKRNLLFTAELFRLLDLFHKAGIQAIPFKGLTLAWPLYEAPGLRPMEDLDLLVQKRDVRRATDLLTASGYRQSNPNFDSRFAVDTGELTLQSEVESSVRIDLHWRLAPAHFNGLDEAYLRGRLAPVDVAGRPVRTFCPEDLLAYLCVNGARHGWSSLGRLHDLGRLIAVHRLDWDAVLSHAEKRRLSRVVFLGLYLVRDLLGAELPAEVWKRVQGDARTAAAAASVLTRLRRDRLGGAPSQELEEVKLRFRLTEGVRRKISFLWYRLQPASADRDALRLPAWLFPVYYFARPLRIIGNLLREPAGGGT